MLKTCFLFIAFSIQFIFAATQNVSREQLLNQCCELGRRDVNGRVFEHVISKQMNFEKKFCFSHVPNGIQIYHLCRQITQRYSIECSLGEYFAMSGLNCDFLKDNPFSYGCCISCVLGVRIGRDQALDSQKPVCIYQRPLISAQPLRQCCKEISMGLNPICDQTFSFCLNATPSADPNVLSSILPEKSLSLLDINQIASLNLPEMPIGASNHLTRNENQPNMSDVNSSMNTKMHNMHSKSIVAEPVFLTPDNSMQKTFLPSLLVTSQSKPQNHTKLEQQGHSTFNSVNLSNFEQNRHFKNPQFIQKEPLPSSMPLSQKFNNIGESSKNIFPLINLNQTSPVNQGLSSNKILPVNYALPTNKALPSNQVSSSNEISPANKILNNLPSSQKSDLSIHPKHGHFEFTKENAFNENDFRKSDEITISNKLYREHVRPASSYIMIRRATASFFVNFYCDANCTYPYQCFVNFQKQFFCAKAKNCPIGQIANNNNRFCKPLNECKIPGINNCIAKIEKCVDRHDGFSCECEPGYKKPLDGRDMCVNVNECNEKDNPCPLNSRCQDLPGTYNCICNEGLEKVGDFCIPKPKFIAPNYPQLMHRKVNPNEYDNTMEDLLEEDPKNVSFPVDDPFVPKIQLMKIVSTTTEAMQQVHVSRNVSSNEDEQDNIGSVEENKGNTRMPAFKCEVGFEWDVDKMRCVAYDGKLQGPADKFVSESTLANQVRSLTKTETILMIFLFTLLFIVIAVNVTLLLYRRIKSNVAFDLDDPI